MLFLLLTNVKMPTIVGILTFMSRKNLCSAKLINIFLYYLGASLRIHSLTKAKRKAIIRNQCNQIPHPPLNPKGKEAHTQIDKLSRQTRTVNRMNSSSWNRWSFDYPYRKQQKYLFLHVFHFKFRTKQNRKQNGDLLFK